MAQIEEQNKRKKIINTVFVFAIIVAFPLISLFVNVTGANQGRKFYGELQQLGSFPQYTVTKINGDTFNSSVLDTTVRVVSFLTDDSADSILTVIRKISKIEQFDLFEADKLRFVSFDLTKDSTKTQKIKEFVAALSEKEQKRWYILRGGDNIAEQSKVANFYAVLLVDLKGQIRRQLDIRKEEDKKLLVELISILPIRTKKNVNKEEQKKI